MASQCMLRLTLSCAQVAQECPPSAQVKAAAAHVQTLKRNYCSEKKKFSLSQCYVPALPPVTNHNLLAIRYCLARVVSSTQLYAGRPSQLSESPNRTPFPKNISFNLSRRILLATRRGAGPCLGMPLCGFRICFVF
jgi:hypothetical protein